MKNTQFGDVRKAMVNACIRLADCGFFAGIGGNLAVRLNEQLMAVTPSGTDYYTMNSDDICIVKIKTVEIIEGVKEPTTESSLHASLLKKRPDLQVSLHTHQPLASAISLLGIDMPIESVEARASIGPCLRIVPYAPSGTSFLRNAFKDRLRNEYNGYLLRNHGVVCGGTSLEHAIANVQFAEQEAARFLRSRIEGNRDVAEIDPHMLQQALAIL